MRRTRDEDSLLGLTAAARQTRGDPTCGGPDDESRTAVAPQSGRRPARPSELSTDGSSAHVGELKEAGLGAAGLSQHATGRALGRHHQRYAKHAGGFYWRLVNGHAPAILLPGGRRDSHHDPEVLEISTFHNTHTHHLDRAGPKGGNLACGLGKGLERVACEGRLPSHALEAKRPTRIIPLPSTQANSPARIAKRSRSLETRC